MVRKGYGRHSVVATGANNPSSQISKDAWNDDLDKTGMLGFSPTTSTIVISTGNLTVTDTWTVAESETSPTADDLANILTTETSTEDIVFLIAKAGDTITLKHQAGGAGQIHTLTGADQILDTNVPTLLIRRGADWYEYGGSNPIAGTNIDVTGPTVSFDPTGGVDMLGNNLTMGSTGVITFGAGETIKMVFDDMRFEVTAGDVFDFLVDGTGEYTFSASEIQLNGNNISAGGGNVFNVGYFESNAGTPSGTGAIRLGNNELIRWRNNADNQDIGISVDTLNRFQFDGGLSEIYANANPITDVSYLESNATNPASAGAIRLGYSELIQWRNQGNTANHTFGADSSDNLELRVDGANNFGVFVNGGLSMQVDDNSVSVLGGYIGDIGGTTDSSVGGLRLANNIEIGWRNAGNTENIALNVDVNDEFLFLHNNNTPSITLEANHTTPAGGQEIGKIKFVDDDDLGARVDYAYIHGEIDDPTNTSKDSSIYFTVQATNSLVEPVRIYNNGLAMGSGYNIVGGGQSTSLSNIGSLSYANGTTLNADATQTTLQIPSGDFLEVRIGAGIEYTFNATSLDVAGNDITSPNSIIFDAGGSPASSGHIRLPNGSTGIRWRNAGDTNDVRFSVDSNDDFVFDIDGVNEYTFSSTQADFNGNNLNLNGGIIQFDDATSNIDQNGNDLDFNKTILGQYNFKINTATEYSFNATQADFNSNALIGVSYFESDSGNNASTGSVRLNTADAIAWRNVANDNDHLLDTSGDTFEFTINGVSEYTFSSTQADFNGNNLTNMGTLSFTDTNTSIGQNSSDLFLDVATGGLFYFRINDVAEYTFDSDKIATNNNNIRLGSGQLQLQGGENRTIQGSDANSEIQYDVATGESHTFRVNDVDEYTFNSTQADFNNNKIVNLGTPTDSGDGATKGYVDSVAQGLDSKDSVRVASTADIDLAVASDPSPVDGVTLANGDRILLKDQTTGAENGIYDCVTATDPTTWVRSSDADVSAEVTSGLYCWVEEGTANGDQGYVLTTNDPITLDTTALVFTQFSGAGQITGGTNITKSGNTLNWDPTGGVDFSNNLLDNASFLRSNSTLAESLSSEFIRMGNGERIAWYNDSPAATGYLTFGETGGVNKFSMNANILDFVMLSNGGDEYEFDSTEANWFGNNLRNVGYLESNATNPAQSGAIRLGYTDQIVFRNSVNSADVSTLGVSATNNATFATNLDMEANNIVNVGVFQSNATNPPTTGTIRLGNNESIYWRNNGNTNNSGIVFNNSSDFVFYFDGVLEYNIGASFVNLNGSQILNANYLESNAGNPASAGAIRLGNQEEISWRNNANNGNLSLAVNSDDQLTFAGTPIGGSSSGGAGVYKARVVSTANINLASATDPNPIDGITVANGDRVLLKDQITGAENGIYDAVTATNPTTWVRSSDFNTSAEVTDGALIVIQQGTIGADSTFRLTTNEPITLDTTALTFTNNINIASNGTNGILSNVLAVEQEGSSALPSVGLVRMANNGRVSWRNAGNTNDHAFQGSSDGIQMRINGNVEYNWNATGFDLKANNLINVGYFESNHGTPATDGVIRLGLNEEIEWSTAGNALAIRGDSGGVFEIRPANVQEYTFGTGSANFTGNDILNIGDILEQDVAVGNIVHDMYASATLADDSIIGALRFRAFDGLSSPQNYARITGVMESDVDASEDGSLHFYVTEAGTHDVMYMSFNDASSGDIEVHKDLEIQFGSYLRFGNINSIRDDGSGMEINVQTGDDFKFTINGANEYTFNNTQLDMQSNNLVDFGYIAQNGAVPPSGAIRLQNNTGRISWYNVTDDEVRSIGVDNGNNLVFYVGTSEAIEYLFGVNQANFLKNDLIDVGDLIEQQVDAGAMVFTQEADILADDTVIGEWRMRADDGLGVRQNYARITGVMESDVDASEDGSMHFYVTEAGTHDVEYMAFNDAGVGDIKMFQILDMNSNNIRNVGYLESNATNPASTGTIRLGNAEAIHWRDQANLTDNIKIYGNTNDDINFEVGGNHYTFANDGADFNNKFLREVSYLQSGASTPATTGAIRLGNTERLNWRNASNTENSGLQGSSDGLQLRVDGNVEYNFGATDLDMLNNNLNIGNGSIEFGTGGSSLGAGVTNMWTQANGVHLNCLTGDALSIDVNGATEFSFGTAMNANSNDLISVGNITMGDATGDYDLNFESTSALVDDSSLGEIRFRHDDGLGVLQNYAKIQGVMESDVDASEDGSLHFYVSEAGTHDVEFMSMNDASTGTVDIFKTLDMNSSNITDVGFIDFGTGSADAGTIRLSNSATIEWEASPAGTNGTLTYDANEIFIFGGGSAPAFSADTWLINGTATSHSINTNGDNTEYGVPTSAEHRLLVNSAEIFTFNATEGMTASHMIQGNKGSDIASADAPTVATTGNYFDITGTTQINHLTTTNIQAGTVIILQFDASVTLTHQAGTPTGDEKDLWLAGATNASMTANDTITLVYDGTNWRETARSVN